MKILLVGEPHSALFEIACYLEEKNDNLNIAPTFNTDMKMQGVVTADHQYYMSNEEVEVAYKNNAFMWVRSNEHISKGCTMTDLYDNDIFMLSFGDFNNISNAVYESMKDDMILCFIDHSKIKYDEDEIYESQFAAERIYASKYLYFCDDEAGEVADVILKYVAGNDIIRNELLEEFS